MTIKPTPVSCRGTIYYWCALGLVSSLLVIPVLTVTYTPLVDYPNHLARVHILYKYADVPAYQSAYTRVLEPLPNLAMELLLLPLLPFVDILAAGKIFLTLTLLLFIVGCHQLGTAIHGRPTWLVLPSLFFVYNSMFFYGFVNYIVGVGVFCLALACRLRLRVKWTVGRFLMLTLLAFLSFVAHLSAYLFIGVTMVVVTAWDYFTGKEDLRTAALNLTPLVLPLVFFVVFMMGGGTLGHVQSNTVSGKIIGVLSLVLTYNYTLDSLLMMGFLGVLIVLLTRLQRVRVDWPIFLSAAIFAFLYLLSPKVLFGSSSADARLILPAALLFTLSLKLSVPPITARLLLLLLLSLASIRVVFIWRTWVNLDKRIAAEVEVLKQLPSGATVYPIFVRSESRQEQKVERSLVHIVLYATIYRQALVPTLFTQEGQVNIAFRYKPNYTQPPHQQPEEWVQRSNEWMPYLGAYDYVWSYGVQGELDHLLRKRCMKIHEAGAFSLWRVDHQYQSHNTPASQSEY